MVVLCGSYTTYVTYVTDSFLECNLVIHANYLLYAKNFKIFKPFVTSFILNECLLIMISKSEQVHLDEKVHKRNTKYI